MTSSKSEKDLLKEIAESANKVKVAVVDIDGILRGKYLSVDKFLSAAKGGFGFCSVVFGWDCEDACYDGGTVGGWHNGYPDLLAQVDLTTYRTIPWDDDIPFFLAQFVQEDGSPLAVCPRQVLRRMVDRAKKSGYTPFFGPEFEWFNFRETPMTLAEKHYTHPAPISPGMFGYSLIRQSQNQPFFAELMDSLQAFGVPIEGLHTETGPGVLEAAITYAEAIEAADRATLFKSAAKEIGQAFDIMPSFMAKWNEKLPGCSGHLHQSLWDKKVEKNLFYDETQEEGMSQLFQHYIAGQLALLPEILPLFAPTINSYKRLVEGYWAPTRASWGIDNRTTALRVIRGGAKSTRLETRISGADINPYLAITAALGAGLYGIEHQLDLADFQRVKGNGYRENIGMPLPKTLYEATMAMKASKAARGLLGDAFVDHFCETRLWECKQFNSVVTSYEIKRYFEII